MSSVLKREVAMMRSEVYLFDIYELVSDIRLLAYSLLSKANEVNEIEKKKEIDDARIVAMLQRNVSWNESFACRERRVDQIFCLQWERNELIKSCAW